MMYLIFRMAEFGIEGGLGALKLSGTGAASIGSMLVHLGKKTGKVLLRQSRIRSALKFGDIDSTVLAVKLKDKQEVAQLMKMNGVTGYFVEENNPISRGVGKMIGKEEDGEKLITLFVRTSDANKMAAIVGGLVTVLGRAEGVNDVPENAPVIDSRTWEDDGKYQNGLKVESTEDVQVEKPIEYEKEQAPKKEFVDRFKEEVSSKRDATAPLIKSDPAPVNKTKHESAEPEQDYGLLSQGFMVNEVSDNPFRGEHSLGEAERPAVKGADKGTPLANGDKPQTATFKKQSVTASEKALPSGKTESLPSSNTSKIVEGSKEKSTPPGVLGVLNQLKAARDKNTDGPAQTKILNKVKER